ncbi:transposase [Mangrovibacterium sp.]|uniref:transposase n=1 Tax=Mangrovibacterium sp. TaxID=1961364 RepID=UPI00356785FA
MNTEPLQYGQFYHIYNRGINSCALFREPTNYEHFLRLYDHHISPVADTYAWVLMGNHFHVLVRIKEEADIKDLQGFEKLEGLKNRNRVNQQFANLFNAYTKAYNKRYTRTGALFEHPFRRIRVESLAQLKYLVYYIHHNPIHHGYCEHYLDYPWSSYLSIMSPKQTRLKRDAVLKWYANVQQFQVYHGQQSLERYRELQLEFIHSTKL